MQKFQKDKLTKSDRLTRVIDKFGQLSSNKDVYKFSFLPYTTSD